MKGVSKTPLVIRACTGADWPEVFPIFNAIVDAGETFAYPERLSSEAARDLWCAQPPGATVVAEEEGAILGTATFGPNRPGRGSHVATASYLVSPTRQGEGVGRALCDYSLEWARSRGYRAMQFNAVVETNHAAIHLYEELGFSVIGTVPRAFHHSIHGLVGLHVMYLEF